MGVGAALPSIISLFAVDVENNFPHWLRKVAQHCRHCRFNDDCGVATQ